MRLAKLFKSAIVLTLIYSISPVSAAEIRCPKFSDPDRDTALLKVFNETPANAMDAKTIYKQDAIYNCLAVLINTGRSRLQGRRPDVGNMKPFVLWAAKAYQYNNDEESAEYVYLLGQEFFKPNQKVTTQALDALLTSGGLNQLEASEFRDGTKFSK